MNGAGVRAVVHLAGPFVGGGQCCVRCGETLLDWTDERRAECAFVDENGQLSRPARHTRHPFDPVWSYPRWPEGALVGLELTDDGRSIWYLHAPGDPFGPDEEPCG